MGPLFHNLLPFQISVLYDALEAWVKIQVDLLPGAWRLRWAALEWLLTYDRVCRSKARRYSRKCTCTAESCRLHMAGSVPSRWQWRHLHCWCMRPCRHSSRPHQLHRCRFSYLLVPHSGHPCLMIRHLAGPC